MKQAYIISRGVEEFGSAREQFAMIVDRLQSAAVLGMEHGEVEGLISREGTELMEAVASRGISMRARQRRRERRVCKVPMAWYEAMSEKGVEGIS